MNPNTCKSRNGTVINNLCPGGSDNKCSILKNSQTSSIKGVGLSCSDRGVLGTCVNINNTKCNAILANGKCSGPSNVKCCLRKKVPPTNSTTKPTTNDNKCISKGGQCMNPNKCKSNNGHVLNNLCPCGSDNKCCVPNNNSTKNNIFTKNNTSTKNNKSTKNNTSTSSTKIEKETSDLCPDKKIVIDISQWQDIQDYDTLAKLYDGVIIRVGDFQGDSDPDVIDEKWKTFYDNLKEKTKIGFYFFTRARTPDRIKKHVQMVYNKIIELENDFPLYIDMENNGGDNKTYWIPLWKKRDDNTEIALAGIKEIQRLGLSAGIYSNLFENASKIPFRDNSLLDYDKIKDTGASIWIAKHSKTKSSNGYDMWQFTGSGKIDKSVITGGVVDKSCQN